jgi:hypothetical protein
MDITGFLINHRHYWGIPHARDIDDRIVQTCYECGAESEVKINLRPSQAVNPISTEQESVRVAEGFTSFAPTKLPVLTRWARFLTILQSIMSLTGRTVNMH